MKNRRIPDFIIYRRLIWAIESVIRMREKRIYISFVSPIFELAFKQFLEGQFTPESEAVISQVINERVRQFTIDQDVDLPKDLVLKKGQFPIILLNPEDSVIQGIYQSDLKILEFRPTLGLQFAIISQKPDAVVIQGIYNFDPVIYDYMNKRYFPKVEDVICKMGGNSYDAADVFQNIILRIMHMVRNGTFRITSSLEGYIIRSARYNWLNSLRSEKIITVPINNEVTQKPDDEQSVVDQMEPTDDFKEVSKWLDELSDKCKTLVKEFIINEKPWEEIALEQGYKNAESARNQKYKCIEPLRKKFKDNGYRLIL